MSFYFNFAFDKDNNRGFKVKIEGFAWIEVDKRGVFQKIVKQRLGIVIFL